MPATKERLVQLLWQGADPFIGFPESLYEHDLQGWHVDHPYLTSSIDTLGETPIIVEVGVWKGASVIAMAERLRANGRDGVVIAVDTWLGSWDHWTSTTLFPQLSFAHGRALLQNKFMSNVVRADLADYVIPLPLDPNNAAIVLEKLNIPVDLIHLDGSLDYRSVHANLSSWWPLLAEGGFLIGDDYRDPNWPEVTQAFDHFFQSVPGIQFEDSDAKCRIRKLTAGAFALPDGLPQPTSSATSLMPTGVTTDFLANKVFGLFRIDTGVPIARTLIFGAAGRLEGYQTGRHWSWIVLDGNLAFLDHNGELTDVFDRFEIAGSSVALAGRLHSSADDYWIRLVEQPRPAPAALTSFRIPTANDASRAGRVAVLVRSHRADANSTT